MANGEKQTYRSLLKSTSLFGGVQVYQILIQVVKSKIIALLLGPLGVGVQGLYTSATQLIQNISSLGLSQSAVRDVSEANKSGDRDRVSKTISIIRKLVWFTGLMGAFVVIVLSPYLSKTSFGNNDHVFPFIFLSVTLLFDQLCVGQKVLLQGLRQLKSLAWASALGSTAGLIACIPMYLIFGVKGIVPTLIITSLANLLLSWYYSSKINIPKEKVSLLDAFKHGKGILEVGIALSISGIMITLISFILRSYIRRIGGIDEVGFFSAGYLIMTSYTNLLFNAMATDYYPRLCEINKDNKQCNSIINQQAEIGSLILAPLMIACVTFVPLVIIILYSREFMATCSYIVFASLGMLFKMASWSIAYVFIAKGESKLFVTNDFLCSVYTLLLNIVGYKYYGLLGLGVSFSLVNILYLIQVYIIAQKRYGFSFNKSFWSIFSPNILLLGVTILLSVFFTGIKMYLLGVQVLIASLAFSIIQLNRRVDLRGILMLRKGKNSK